ncbi:glycosyltransferase family 4 protein [Comamonas thiooxydans]|uniref:Glycosyltransferase family 4 protein n=1 Tax=Comamonas thiooxydans TaxID=363952 RepID=A0AA42TSH5_9BURK|nr:glycosyltransferase family 4 protein [Comamonas thiooxydans]MDH1333225.1 glycosyltransferase family 4 protein [Comamonas thiooxydans]MDH1474560.1 glycosyltransferase family 4 protein [Comamonas thiooxydans]MDH1739002.1 glycosyltransferase family 4 protein [Comamonas thiooxydans]MDH1786095.1 glycosyltransferase family 4 protein [Comamonas thiooxydans]
MKICLVGTVAHSTLNFRGSLISRLCAQGHQVFVLCTDFKSQDKAEVQRLGAIPVDYTLSRGGLNPFADIRSTCQLLRQFRRIGPDIVFSFFAKPVIFGSVAARLAGVPRIVGMLEGLGYAFTMGVKGARKRLKQSLVRNIQLLLYRASLRYLDRLIFLNPDDREDLLVRHHIQVRDTQILGGIGVDLAALPALPPPQGICRFLFIGRLIREKGIHEFIQAAQTVKRQYPSAEFVVLGSIDRENPGGLTDAELQALLNTGTIIYPGHVSNVVEWITHCSVFVLPSYREGVPRSTQEAMACGRAIITTNVPGCRDTIVEGVNGLLTPPMESKELARSMLYFIEHPERIATMGKESRKMAEALFDSEKQDFKLIQFLMD